MDPKQENPQSERYCCLRGKLTKKSFMSFETGLYLCSNCWNYKGSKPIFSEYVAPPERRQEQWRRVVASGASQRRYMLFPNEQAFKSFLKRHPEFEEKCKDAWSN